ncbi:MAG: acyl-CoA dehydrogenase family protein [Pseudomonadota bacterium]|nr:acyl-CoA dehydrogenase family protein [Pseudomonadota bacterium]MEC7251322.1 acyl-CoA dehydrogenase family protein [Pseudomonadota bacterium]MEC7969034.1 acyl-CoA dehydrogenase family protein [Pseudomonadota bacterium]MEC8696343.1 acyl-CoA dehydrogenase family protein [Pseudomonadota bacterium]MED6341885.1 acyl-CoA dehydrogenase family protein [Pseudomonadota bacterium]
MSEALLNNAQRLSKSFALRSAEFEQARRLPADVSDAMAKAGIYRMFVPQSLGGSETSPLVSSQVFETLAQGDAACGWVAFIAATSGSSLARIETSAAKQMFASPQTMLAGVFAPNGKAVKSGEDYILNGQWQWGSGTQNADWVLAGSMVIDPEQPADAKPRAHMCLVPKDAIEFLDTWHSTGLRGTGSTDFKLTDHRVPSAHIVGLEVRKMPDTPLFQFPNFTLLALGIGAVSMGIARAALNEFVGLAQQKKRISSSSTIAERSHTQMQIATAEAKLRSARAFYYDSVEQAWERALAGDTVDVDQRRNLRLATTHAVMASAEVVDCAYNLAGGVSVYQSSNLQRHFRDIHVATQHIMVAPSTLETTGRLFLGLPTNTATL